MSYVAVTFPAKGSKSESLASAKKFAKKIGLEESDVSSIRRGVYGCILPSDVSSIVLTEASKLGGKVVPFVESKSVVEEGKWLTLNKAVAGTRFEMSGTTPVAQADGRIMPDKFYVLGIQESEGGVYATLGRVDKLIEIGRKSGPGRYIYNVPLDVLRESILSDSDSVADEVKSTDGDTSAETTNESTEQDRSMEILDMLLENDQFVARDNRKADLKKRAAQERSAKDSVIVESEEDLLASLVEESIKNPQKVDYSAEELANYKPLTEGSAPVTEGASDELGDDGAGLLDVLLGQVNENHDDTDTTDEPVVDQQETQVAATEDVEEEEADKEEATDDDAEEEMDPEVYESVRGIIDAMVEAGIDVDSLDDEQLEEAVNDFMAYLESLEDGEDGEVVAEDEESAEDAETSEEVDSADDTDGDAENAESDEEQETKKESMGSDDFEDSGFEATPADAPVIKEVGEDD